MVMEGRNETWKAGAGQMPRHIIMTLTFANISYTRAAGEIEEE
jgi:hypothetical protein